MVVPLENVDAALAVAQERIPPPPPPLAKNETLEF